MWKIFNSEEWEPPRTRLDSGPAVDALMKSWCHEDECQHFSVFEQNWRDRNWANNSNFTQKVAFNFKKRVSERRSSHLHLNIYMLQSLRLLIFSIHISFQGGGTPGSLSTRSEWKLIFGRWSLRGVGVEVEVELLFCARSLIFKQLEAGLWGDTRWSWAGA